MNNGWSSQKCCPTTLLLSAKTCRNSNHYTNLANEPSLSGVERSLVQIEHTYPSLTAILLKNNGWSSQKCCPTTLLLSAKLWRCNNHLKTSVNMPFWTDTGMTLDQIKYSYPSLTAFIMTDHWLKQSKILPSHVVVECQNMKEIEPPQNSC